MEITILFFGQLEEITGKSIQKLSGVSSTDALKKGLEDQYPTLKNLTYSIAVNKKITPHNTSLKAEDEVALLPPFSGG